MRKEVPLDSEWKDVSLRNPSLGDSEEKDPVFHPK
jgi:hypothetical protein